MTSAGSSKLSFECLERNPTQTCEAFVHFMGGRERDEDVLLLGTNLGF
jgi:hypothetical protein